MQKFATTDSVNDADLQDENIHLKKDPPAFEKFFSTFIAFYFMVLEGISLIKITGFNYLLSCLNVKNTGLSYIQGPQVCFI